MYTPIQYHTGDPSQYNKRKEKEKTHRKDKIKPSLLIGDKIIYMEHHKESQKKKKNLLEFKVNLAKLQNINT